MKSPNFKFIVLFIITFFSLASMNAQDSKQQKEIINKLQELHKPTFKTRDSLSLHYKAISEKIGYTSDTVIKKNLYKKIEELDKISDKNNDKELDREFGFIRQYNSNPIALDILYYKVTKRESANYYETFNALFSSLSYDLQNSPKGKELKDLLINFNSSNVGSHAPNFDVKDIRNSTLSLSSFENKNYVLLNFWTSNSQACKDEISFLKDIYLKNKQNGLEIVSISLDESIEVLRKAIDYEKIDMWKHVPIIMNEDAFLLDNFFVNSIPQKILIDKNGIIIGRWRGASESNQKEINAVLGSLFKVVASANVTH
jgi:peroxiredoxin